MSSGNGFQLSILMKMGLETMIRSLEKDLHSP